MAFVIGELLGRREGKALFHSPPGGIRSLRPIVCAGGDHVVLTPLPRQK